MAINWQEKIVDPNETPVALLTNGNMQNIISGEGIKNEVAFITNKRLYYSKKKGMISKITEDDKIDLQDITGTRIVGSNPLLLLVLAIIFGLFSIISLAASPGGPIGLFFTSLVPALAFVIGYFAARKNFMYIEYAGGCIHFSLIGYTAESIKNFQNAIYIAKENLKYCGQQYSGM